jgi:protein-S-isoprenylcysteine O-methyltransferase Ste14
MEQVMAETKQMSIFGVGPKIARVSIAYLLVTVGLSLLFRKIFIIPLVPPKILLLEGIFLMIIGLAVNLLSALPIIKAVKEGKLITTGYYSICRNPMYSSFIFLTVPGLGLALNSWLVITTSIIICIALYKFIPGEEILLEKTFGDEYRAYKKKVSRIIPFFIMKK